MSKRKDESASWERVAAWNQGRIDGLLEAAAFVQSVRIDKWDKDLAVYQRERGVPAVDLYTATIANRLTRIARIAMTRARRKARAKAKEAEKLAKQVDASFAQVELVRVHGALRKTRDGRKT